jgi:anti-sigma regulatory factor (Ser/Thr protein kinase)
MFTIGQKIVYNLIFQWRFYVNKTREQSEKILSFILMNVRQHPKDITSMTALEFGITRQAVLRHLRKLIEKDVIVVHGKTRDRNYELSPLAEKIFEFQINNDLQEDVVWRENILPLVKGLKDNILEICSYGVTEMINNVIDHSGGNKLTVILNFFIDLVDIIVIDDGIGIFQKITSVLNLDDKLHAILELSKGKLTTDPENHTGEGIFFTSRAFDTFVITSDNIFFSHKEESGDWLLEEQDNITQGTVIRMQIKTLSQRKLINVFNKYASGEDFGFTKTNVPVALARYGNESLISRSQAKRLLARFDKFREIILNFEGVDTIGQAFADEIFRVFQQKHPDIHLIPISTNANVQLMINRAKGHNNQLTA